MGSGRGGEGNGGSGKGAYDGSGGFDSPSGFQDSGKTENTIGQTVEKIARLALPGGLAVAFAEDVLGLESGPSNPPGGGGERGRESRASAAKAAAGGGSAGGGAADPLSGFKSAQNAALDTARERATSSNLSSWRQEDFLSSFMADQRGHQEFLAGQDNPDYSAATKSVKELSGRGSTLQDLFPTPEWWNV